MRAVFVFGEREQSFLDSRGRLASRVVAVANRFSRGARCFVSEEQARQIPLPGYALLVTNEMPQGARLALEVLSRGEETSLLAEIEDWTEGWEHPLLRAGLRPSRREMRCFGWSYVTRGRMLVQCEPLPKHMAAPMRRWLVHGGVSEELLEQVIVTRYRDGAGIGWHTDAPVFGSTVATLSLGADWRMEFRRRSGDQAIRVALPRRSLLVLSGEARAQWQHRIPAVRATRISLSFRTVVERSS
jgi:alkylated DNA repair protein (DNA oxidative demethylase)